MSPLHVAHLRYNGRRISKDYTNMGMHHAEDRCIVNEMHRISKYRFYQLEIVVIRRSKGSKLSRIKTMYSLSI
jgi:hypothetical protein